MKNTLRKTLCLITAVTMASAAFAGCRSDQAQNTQSQTAADVEELKASLAFEPVTVNAPEGYSIGYSVSYKDGIYYSTYTDYKDDGGIDNKIIAFDASGLKQVYDVGSVGAEEWGSMQGGMKVDKEGNVICIFNKATYSDEGAENTYTMYKFAPTGELKEQTDLTAAFNSEMGENAYMQGFLIDDDGNLIINFSSAVCVFDKTGTKLFDIKNNNENAYISQLLFTNAGVPAYLYGEYSAQSSKSLLVEIDMAAKAKGREYDISDTGVYSLFSGSGDYLFYSRSDTGLVGVKPDMTKENVLNLLNIGVDNSSTDSFSVIEDGSFVMTQWNDAASGNAILHVKPVAADQVKEKKMLTLGCFNVPYYMRAGLADFNKTNSDYVITVNSYSEQNSVGDYDAALTKFNNELLAGNVPDILIVDTGMPYDSYISKGLLTDMYPLMDADDQVKREDILPNVLRAYENDGKMMIMPCTFYVRTCAASAGDVDANGYFSLSAAKSRVGSDGVTLADGMTREDFLQTGIFFSDFFDLKNGKCDFDNPAFKTLLEESKNHPAENAEEWTNDQDTAMDREQAFMKGKELVYGLNIMDFDFYYDKAHLTKDYVFTNFPTDAPKAKSIILSDVLVAVSENCQNKDVAWDFISYVMQHMVEKHDYQYWDDEGNSHTVEGDSYYDAWNGFPVLKKDFEELKAHATVPNHYYDSTGKAVYEQRTVWLGDADVKVDDLTEEEVNRLADMITSTDTAVPSMQDIYNTIIKDEVQSFWAGTNNADQTASMIQSRVSLYLSEHY
ncbi:MAG: hypothetical protein IJ080_03340 [Oscillospiraceae bacterium]|nr:hypothetical protein [Oscillospiraceae bacterium]